MIDQSQLRDARTFLFVPGNRPDRFDKAVAAGADVRGTRPRGCGGT